MPSLYASEIEHLGSTASNNFFAITVINRIAYCTNDAGLMVLDCSNADRPIPIGQCQLNGWCHDIAIDGNYAIVSNVDDGLPIIDISNPKKPKVMAYYKDARDIRSVFLKGSLAFISDKESGLLIIDINDPSKPQKIGSYATNGEIQSIAANDKYVLIGIGSDDYFKGQSRYIEMLDITDPSSPKSLGSYYTKGKATSIVIKGNYAFVFDGGYGLLVQDISDPNNLKLAGQAEIVNDGHGSIFVYGNYAFISPGSNRTIKVFDINAPSNPKLIETAADSMVFWRISFEDDKAYIINKDAQILIMNISNVLSPEIKGLFAPPRGIKDVAVVDDIAYVTAEDFGLIILGLKRPRNNDLIGHLELGSKEFLDVYRKADRIVVDKSIAYITMGSEGLLMVDVANPSNPRIIGSMETPDRLTSIFVKEGYAYLAANDAGLLIVDISTPAHPNIVGKIRTTSPAMDIVVQGNFAYMACEYSGMQIFDISDKTKPNFQSSYDTQYASGIDVSGSIVFLADAVKGLFVIDVSDMSNPILASKYKLEKDSTDSYDFQFEAVKVKEQNLFLLQSRSKGGIYVMDIKDISDPKLIANYFTGSHFCEHLMVQGKTIYVPENSSLEILNFKK